jgi:hypothetical protein
VKELLAQWAILEPTLCKRETRPNQDWHEEFENYYIKTGTGWQVVHIDCTGAYASIVNVEGLARIQWVTQQAIIQRQWFLEIHYTPESGYEAIVIIPSRCRATGYSNSNMAEALLDAYLEVLGE